MISFNTVNAKENIESEQSKENQRKASIQN